MFVTKQLSREILSRFKLTICENASFYFVQSDKIQVALNHVAAKRSVSFGARALTGVDRVWFKTSSQRVSAAMREVVTSAKSDDEHYRHEVLVDTFSKCIRLRLLLLQAAAALISKQLK